jgi:hypothetical protein
VEAITTLKNDAVVTNVVRKERQRFLEKNLLLVTASYECCNNITLCSFEFLSVVCYQ